MAKRWIIHHPKKKKKKKYNLQDAEFWMLCLHTGPMTQPVHPSASRKHISVSECLRSDVLSIRCACCDGGWCVDPDPVDSENNLWLWSSVCLWDDGIFILAAMNYWGVESATSRTGVCVWVCVCIHVWWDLLVDSLMLRLLLTSASYTSHFSLIYRFSIFQPHTLHHSILPILCFCVMFALLHWSHEAICLPLFGSFSVPGLFLCHPLYIFMAIRHLLFQQPQIPEDT